MSRHTHEERTTLFVLEMQGITRWYERGEVSNEDWCASATRIANRYGLSDGHVRHVIHRSFPRMYDEVVVSASA